MTLFNWVKCFYPCVNIVFVKITDFLNKVIAQFYSSFIIIIIISLFQKNDIFGTNAGLTKVEMTLAIEHT